MVLKILTVFKFRLFSISIEKYLKKYTKYTIKYKWKILFFYILNKHTNTIISNLILIKNKGNKFNLQGDT